MLCVSTGWRFYDIIYLYFSQRHLIAVTLNNTIGIRFFFIFFLVAYKESYGIIEFKRISIKKSHLSDCIEMFKHMQMIDRICNLRRKYSDSSDAL